MTWARKRQFLILGSIAAIVLALVAVTAIAVIYDTPTCTDGKQNGEETGVDCGGACTYLCLAEVERPIVRFVRAFSPQPNRYDVIAYIDNRNAGAAAREVETTIELYSDTRELVTTRTVSIDIPAGTTVPLYIPEAYRGEASVAQVFVTFNDATLRFYEPKDDHIVPIVAGLELENTDAPRVRATLENPSAFTLYGIKPIATVFDIEGNALAASQTYVSQIGAYGKTNAFFTWNAPFVGTPARVEVLPVMSVSLP